MTSLMEWDLLLSKRRSQSKLRLHTSNSSPQGDLKKHSLHQGMTFTWLNSMLNSKEIGKLLIHRHKYQEI